MNQWKRNIILFLTSQSISLFGSSLVQYAIMWHVTLETKSGFIMTLFILCGFVPTLIISPFAGVWVDQYNRKKLIAISDGAIACTTLILAVIFLIGYNALWLLMLGTVVRACGAAIQTPAVNSTIPQMIPEEQLTKINGINSSIQAATMFLAPITSAFLLTFAELETIFFIDVVTASIAILILIFFISIPSLIKVQEASRGYISNLKMGMQYIQLHSFLKPFFIYFALLCFLIVPVAFLTPLQVARSFGDEVWRLTSIELSFSSGMVLGGLFIASWGGFRNRVHTILLASLVLALTTVVLGVVPTFLLYCFVLFITGIALPAFTTPVTVFIQETIESNYMGRVFGIFGMINSSMVPLGMLLFGPVADFISIEFLLKTTGLLMIIIICLFALKKNFVKEGYSKSQHCSNPSSTKKASF